MHRKMTESTHVVCERWCTLIMGGFTFLILFICIFHSEGALQKEKVFL